MKKLFLTLAIAVIGFTSIYAQNTTQQKQTPEQKAEKSTAKLQKELSLTADQKQKVYALELDKFKQASDLKTQNTADKKSKKQQHKAIKEATDAKLAAVLTADQKTKLAAIKADKKSRHGKHNKTDQKDQPAKTTN